VNVLCLQESFKAGAGEQMYRLDEVGHLCQQEVVLGVLGIECWQEQGLEAASHHMCVPA
jgi:hypothetical protein